MKKRIPIPYLLCLFCLVSGCATAGEGSSASLANPKEAFTHITGGNLRVAELSLPLGTRLGAPYISALGENCYEVSSQTLPPLPVQALCQRSHGWELLPSIYMDIPAVGTQPAGAL